MLIAIAMSLMTGVPTSGALAQVSGATGGAAARVADSGPSDTAWKEGHPALGLKHADALVARFKDKASHLGRDGKLRVLIIGDSLSDGHYQLVALLSQGTSKPPKATEASGISGRPGEGTPGRAGFLARMISLRRSRVAGVPDGAAGATPGPISAGTANSWPPTPPTPPIASTPAGVASRPSPAPARSRHSTAGRSPIGPQASPPDSTISSKTAGPARPGEPLDISLTQFEAPEGRHTLRVDAVKGRHPLTSTASWSKIRLRGSVVYNISRGGYWAHNYLWRQPGWEKILTAMDPDLTILFLTKPESGGSGGDDGPNRSLRA